eukprot:TRINITY_DN2513_c0_g1_i1.p1 TRINITY_DN2513_c0_g1~~TRINITY_DN2513_c0_g1_i1.p1  ORF type:complete len:222 (+),score=43.12 TRINITY_DN2513_c0_g1_i1:117-782(+)
MARGLALLLLALSFCWCCTSATLFNRLFSGSSDDHSPLAVETFTPDPTNESQVCGYDHITYPSADDAHANNTGVMHCGPCGACSNHHDIQIYNVTRNTLTNTSFDCALVTAVLGENAGDYCMNKYVGFTTQCNTCWMQDIECNKKDCAWTCLMYKIFGSLVWKPKTPDDLNPCLACDETDCGPAFKQCAGANRRRCGIVSDIDRPDDEICKVVDPWPASIQ